MTDTFIRNLPALLLVAGLSAAGALLYATVGWYAGTPVLALAGLVSQWARIR